MTTTVLAQEISTETATVVPRNVCRIKRLATEADWLSIRDDFEKIEQISELNPWLNWQYQMRLFQLGLYEGPCWAILVGQSIPDVIGFDSNPGPLFSDGTLPLAGGLYREYRSRKRFLQPRALRLFDEVDFMRTPPFLMRHSAKHEASSAWVDSMPQIRAEIGADILAFYATDLEYCEPFLKALDAAGRTARIKTAVESPRCRLGESFEHFLETHIASHSKDVQTQHRRFKNRFGDSTEFRRIDQIADEHDWQSELDRLFGLRKKTWQHKWEIDSGRVDHQVLLPRMRCALDVWKKRGILRMFFQEVKGEPISFSVFLVNAPRVWAIWTGYDADYKSFSPGKVVFLDALRQCHAEGVRLLDMGGPVGGWKEPWTTDTIDVIQIETAIGGMKSKLLELLANIRS
jgi:Acetyltransferase (GNAT) domain